MRRRAAALLCCLCAAPASAQTPSPGPDWLPRGGVELQALDKVTARSTVLTGKVGQSLRFGSLTITVTACLVRPPDQPQDAAAFLDISDSHPNGATFRGWILAAEPSVAMFEHPLYDVRLNGCRP